MNIDEAARATRKYWSAPHWEYQDVYFAHHAGCDPENVGALYGSWAEAQAACDRLNLLAVLEAIRDALMQEQGIDTKQERCIYDI